VGERHRGEVRGGKKEEGGKKEREGGKKKNERRIEKCGSNLVLNILNGMF